MSVRPRVWVFNFDADDELMSPKTYGGPRPSIANRFHNLVTRVGCLLATGDIIWDPTSQSLKTDGLTEVPRSGELGGQAWCPTPYALTQLARAGVTHARAPSLAILRDVNHRQFCAALGQPLPGAQFVASMEDARKVISKPTGLGDSWLLKRAFSYAGRGRRKVRAGVFCDEDAAFIRASLRRGDGLQIEPWVESRQCDFAIHGYIFQGQPPRYGEVTLQMCDAFGAWLGSRRAAASDCSEAERRLLRDECERVADALANVGYFGPFGIDAYRYQNSAGNMTLNARSEINARFTMGFSTGFGAAP